MSLHAQILDAFLAQAEAPTQGGRLLVLHTPLGVDVLLAERAEIDECIGPQAEEPAAGFRMVVHALAADTHLELKSLVGQPVLLEMLTAASRTQMRPFHGHVTEAALLGSDGGLARFRLVVEPWLAFLGHRRDAFVFQGKSVVEIVDEVFADYAGQGRLVPAWRWELADRSVYAQRSLCIQYQESDLDFVVRLLREEGLFFWFEHAGASDDAGLGAHTLVIADHNGAFAANPQADVRYTQAGAALPEDSMTKWREAATLQAASVELASHDYRSLSLRPQSQAAHADAGRAAVASLALIDVPGVYAYEDTSPGERLARCQMQALDALRAGAEGRGTLRQAAPATTFVLRDHPRHDGSDDARDRFVLLAVRHRARSNLRADLAAQVHTLLGSIAAVNASGAAGHTAGHVFGVAPERLADARLPNQSEEPLYGCRIRAQRAAVPVRFAGVDEAGLPDPRLHPRPTVHGVQTAIVVGAAGEPIHTDRDHRVKVQFHWQRGARASHRLEHGSGDDNAPASDAAGTWVRVAAGVAGANWGAVFAPRVGQEVLVQFIAGDIDRAVVVGSVYNGEGNADAQGNRVAGAAAAATGNAVAWFPGSAAEGRLESHRHPAVLAGHKSQEMSTSQGGAGGYNQLVFDDSASGNRIELASSSAETRLQLGRLQQQSDNRRLQPRGHGVDLGTAGWGALRAGAGVLISAHGRPGSQSAGSSLDSREPAAQLERGVELVHTLAESAQQHNAKVDSEPDVVGAQPDDTARQLASEQALHAAAEGLNTTDQRADTGSADAGASADATIGGGAGQVAAWSRPELVVAAPAGIGAFTPATLVASAGATLSLVAGQDLQLMAQANQSWAVQGGLVFYTYGKASDGAKPNQETGIRLHAGTGNVNVQAQAGAARLTADKKIEVASTAGMVRVTAPQHVLLTAAGAAIDIQAGSITLKGPGKIEFKASMKELTGAGSASQSVALAKPGTLKGCVERLKAASAMGAAAVAV